jgi:hypothetical protein
MARFAVASAGWLATPNLIIFGTGGLAYGRTEQSANFVFGSNINAPLPGAAGGFTTNCVTNAVCFDFGSDRCLLLVKLCVNLKREA